MASTANSASRKPGAPRRAARERHALGEELAHQPAAGDPEGEPDADLLLPRRRLDQQQAARGWRTPPASGAPVTIDSRSSGPVSVSWLPGQMPSSR